ncbi:MAG: tetratricopeptide repeat protein [Parvularculaceae bacterium]
MRIRHVMAASMAAALLAPPVLAQMSVTTFGATDAVQCFENARNDFSRDSEPCDKALAGPLTSDDKKKTLVNRGVIRNREGKLMEAMEDFNNAIDIDSGLAEAYLNRGNSYYLGARYDQAISDYEQALHLDVSKPWAAWYNIGLARDARSDAAGAKAAYEKALELNPDFYAAKQKLGRG